MFNSLDVIALIIGGIGVVGSLYFRFKPADGTSAADNAKEREKPVLYWIFQGLVGLSILLIVISLFNS